MEFNLETIWVFLIVAMSLYQRIDTYHKVWVIQTDQRIIRGMDTDTEEVTDLLLSVFVTPAY